MSENMNVGGMLTEQLNRLFDKSVTRTVLVDAEAGTLPPALWTELENIGVAHALVSEDAGGVGLTWADTVGVWQAIGYHAAPVPLGETMIGRWALALAGIDIPEGPLAIVENLLQLDTNGTLNGNNVLLPWVDQVEHFVAVAEGKDGLRLCLVHCDAVASIAAETISRIPCGRISLAQVTPVAVAPLPAPLGALGLLPELAVLRATQMSGCLERLLTLCVEYGNTRSQFGKPLGKFQAIQHLIATLAEQTAAAQVAGAFGCRSLDKGDQESGVAVAKIQVGQAAATGTAIAHQVFGAIGVTDEHTLHYFTRRLWQWRDEGESEHWWAERLGRKVIAAGGEALWPNLIEW